MLEIDATGSSKYISQMTRVTSAQAQGFMEFLRQTTKKRRADSRQVSLR